MTILISLLLFLSVSFTRWVLCANHTEPVKGFLGRFLRRKLMETEISSRVRNAELVKIIEWIPGVWHHLNHFLETHSSSDVTIGEIHGKSHSRFIRFTQRAVWSDGHSEPSDWLKVSGNSMTSDSVVLALKILFR